MCRLLGVVTRERSSLLESVPEELPLFTALSERHKDGWGVAWYADDRGQRPREAVEDEASAAGSASGGFDGADRAEGADGADSAAADPDEELRREVADAASGLVVRRGVDTARASNDYGTAALDADGEIVIAHLRRATAGLRVTLVNTHPFTEGPVAFAHNGQFDLPEGFREKVLAAGGRAPRGTTDSELYFSLITLHAREHDWATAIQRAAADVTAWVQELGGRYPEGLNCLLMTPDALYGYAQSDPEQLEATSRWDVYDLMHRADEDRVVITSTGYEQNGYTAVGQGAAITVRRGTLAVEHRSPLPGFQLASSRAEGELAWARRRPDAPGAQPSLAALEGAALEDAALEDAALEDAAG